MDIVILVIISKIYKSVDIKNESKAYFKIHKIIIFKQMLSNAFQMNKLILPFMILHINIHSHAYTNTHTHAHTHTHARTQTCNIYGWTDRQTYIYMYFED